MGKSIGEALAIHETTKKTMQLNLDLILESDSQIVINYITSKTKSPSYILDLVCDIIV